MRNILIVAAGVVAVILIACGVYYGTRQPAPSPSPVAVTPTPDASTLLTAQPDDHVLHLAERLPVAVRDGAFEQVHEVDGAAAPSGGRGIGLCRGHTDQCFTAHQVHCGGLVNSRSTKSEQNCAGCTPRFRVTARSGVLSRGTAISRECTQRGEEVGGRAW